MHLCLIAALAVMASAFELPRGADARVRSRPSADAARRAAAVGPSPPTSRGRSPRLSETVLATAAGGGAAAAEVPAATRAGSLVAGAYSGLMQFTFAAACASIIFGPVGLPLTIGIQHCLLAFGERERVRNIVCG